MEGELQRLKRKVTKIVNHCDKIGYLYSDLELAAFNNIGNAEMIDQVNPLALQCFEILRERLRRRG